MGLCTLKPTCFKLVLISRFENMTLKQKIVFLIFKMKHEGIAAYSYCAVCSVHVYNYESDFLSNVTVLIRLFKLLFEINVESPQQT